jgi:hypothetical protein
MIAAFLMTETEPEFGIFQCQCMEDSFLENDGVSCRGKVKSKIEDDRF